MQQSVLVTNLLQSIGGPRRPSTMPSSHRPAAAGVGRALPHRIASHRVDDACAATVGLHSLAGNAARLLEVLPGVTIACAQGSAAAAT